MPEKVSITKTKLDNLANAISAKSGEPLNLTIDEMEAAVNGINIGEENILEGVKVNGVELPIDSQKKVNIPAVSQNKAGVMTPSIMDGIYYEINSVYTSIPDKVSQLTNDEGYISTETDPTVPSWAKEPTKPTYTASEVGALPDTTVITDEKLKVDNNVSSNTNYYPILTTNSTAASTKTRSSGLAYVQDSTDDTLTVGYFSSTLNRRGAVAFQGGTSYKVTLRAGSISSPSKIITIPDKTGTMALTDDIPSVPSWALESTKPTYTAQEVGALPDTTEIPTKVSDLTNDSNYQTDTEVNNAITDALADIVGFSIEIVNTLPATGEDGVFYFVPNSGEQDNIYDEYLYVNNAWEKLGTTEIDLSNYLQKTDIADWAKAPTKPTYTAQEVGALPDTTTIPTKTSQLTNDSGFITSASLPTKVSDLTNDSGFITNSEEDDPVFTASAAYGIQSSDITNWNNKSDFSGDYNDLTNKPTIPTVPTNVSAFTNDAGYLTSYTETDPVFSASPAAGITSSNITNWNNYYKVRQENVSNDAIYPILLGYQVGDVAVTEKTLKSSNNFNFNPSTGNLKATTFNSYTLKGACAKAVDTSISTGSSSTDLPTSAAVANFVENKGYLTLEDLPIYDGTVV